MTSRQPRVCLYVGPSLSVTEARTACAEIQADLELRPPIQQGDLLGMLDDLPSVIGIIDGYFLNVPAVPHKEIMVAIERGARVLGAASMGALRAAELDAFGMEGVGRIYRLYRRGIIDGDDEVAVLHGDETDAFRPLTEALVNVRHKLRRARALGLISAATQAAVLGHARRLCFTDRTLDNILRCVDAGASRRGELTRLGDFLRKDRIDLKRADALSLVRTIAERLGGAQSWPTPPATKVNRTTFLWHYERTYVGHSSGGQYVADSLVLAFHKLLSPDFPTTLRQIALRCLAIDEAIERGTLPEDAEALVAQFRHSERLRTPAAYQAWLSEHWMSPDELVASLSERDLETKLLALYRRRWPHVADDSRLYRRIASDVAGRTGATAEELTRPLLMRCGVPWEGPLIRELKLSGKFGSALALASRILQHEAALSRRIPWFSRTLIPGHLIDTWIADRWHVNVESLGAALLDHGFANYTDVEDPARYAYLYERSRAADPRPVRGEIDN